MTEELALLAATVEDLLAQRCPPATVDAAAEGSGFAAEVWGELERAGLTLLPVPEEHGGAGAGLDELAVVLLAAGMHAAPVPLVETWLAGSLLAAAGEPVPAGPLTAAAAPEVGAAAGGRLSGTVARVPYARTAGQLVLVLADGSLAVVEPGAGVQVHAGRNLAREPRDELVLDGAPARVLAAADPAELMLRGALGRSLLIAGAAERALEQSVRYAGERVQFGRPIARFQAVQQHLAEMAGEVAAARTAALAAARAVQAGAPLARQRVAAAKHQAGVTAGVVARLAHQVHGAIGFTGEHVLRHATTRLWSWREDYGNEQHWAHELGEWALDSAAAGGLWPALTTTG